MKIGVGDRVEIEYELRDREPWPFVSNTVTVTFDGQPVGLLTHLEMSFNPSRPSARLIVGAVRTSDPRVFPEDFLTYMREHGFCLDVTRLEVHEIKIVRNNGG